jgi:hypothetical protein
VGADGTICQSHTQKSTQSNNHNRTIQQSMSDPFKREEIAVSCNPVCCKWRRSTGQLLACRTLVTHASSTHRCGQYTMCRRFAAHVSAHRQATIQQQQRCVPPHDSICHIQHIFKSPVFTRHAVVLADTDVAYLSAYGCTYIKHAQQQRHDTSPKVHRRAA